MLARFRAAPVALSLGTATAKTAAADAVTQRYLEGSTTLDYGRLSVFTCFGFWYLGN